jgi:nicotinate-nucleotide pyrophosphorylase (carboxylating)
MLALDDIIRNALKEDIHTGDLTTQAMLSGPRPASARLLAKEEMIVAGLAAAARVFTLQDAAVRFEALCSDGDRISSGTDIARISGDASVLLQGERVALNLLQRMSGIATLTDRFVQAVKSTSARIVDTRKTTPGLRILEKYAVRIGGGVNHRTGLYDGILIKENHIIAAGGIREVVEQARTIAPSNVFIEVEVEDLDELREALDAGVTMVLLDNMSLEEMREAVAITAGRAELEASGGVNLERVRAIAETGVDRISIGTLTKDVRALDLSLRHVED